MVVDLLAFDDACAVPLIDTTRVTIVIEPPPNTKPKIEPKKVTHVITSESELYELIINGTDLDGDELILDIIPLGFSLEDYGMSFSDVISNPGALTTSFIWDADCRRLDFTERSVFNLLVVIDDEDECLFSEPDTLELNLVFELPPNNKPDITFENANDNTITVDVNSPIDIDILGVDIDDDSISIDLLQEESSPLPPGVSFTPVTGIGNAATNFSWTPGCDDVLANGGNGTFNFDFLVNDNNCLSNKADTITLEIVVQDGNFNLEQVQPSNVFTPLNRDQFNPIYYVQDLPPGNCQNQFEGVTIYNRWGKLVFEDDQLDFEWDGSDIAPGIYYYLIKYTQSEIKGYVSVLDSSTEPQ
jgi:gliding motility-associated-like protein